MRTLAIGYDGHAFCSGTVAILTYGAPPGIFERLAIARTGQYRER
jgi:hypothetical protein